MPGSAVISSSLGLFIFAQYVIPSLGVVMGCVEHAQLRELPLAVDNAHTSDCESLHHEFVVCQSFQNKQHAQLVQMIGPEMAKYQP